MRLHPVLAAAGSAALASALALASLPALAQGLSDEELLQRFLQQRDALRAAQTGDLGATRGLKLMTVEDLTTAPDVAQVAPAAPAAPDATGTRDATALGSVLTAGPSIQSDIAAPTLPGADAPVAGGVAVATETGVAATTAVGTLGAPDAPSGAGVTVAGTTQPSRPVATATTVAAAPTADTAPPVVPPALVYADLPSEITVEERITFGFDSATLDDDQLPKLDQLCRVMKASGIGLFRIVGHTDASGSDEYNERLSLLRAQEVKRYFVSSCGIPADQLEAVGLGERFPSQPEDPRAPANRRVEFQALS